MRLTSFTDYGLRALMLLAARPDQSLRIADLARELALSHDHLAKIMLELAAAGVVATQRGRGGGLRLARPAAEIRLGEVTRLLEARQAMVECFRADGGACNLTPRCRLKGHLAIAEEAFYAALDRASLADCALREVTRRPGDGAPLSAGRRAAATRVAAAPSKS